MDVFDLQLFAEAGNVVNASEGYVNAYTGETQGFSGENNLSQELKTFYDTELLENARVELFYAQFAKLQPLPAGGGSKVEWRKWNTFEKAGILQEGVIPTGQKFGLSTRTGVINQYGTYTALSDRLAACFSAQGARVLSRTFWQDEVPAAVAELYGGYGRQHVEGDR